MDRATFARRFQEAATASREFAQTFIEEALPEEIRFRLRLNSSYDGGRRHPDVTVYPEDSAPERRKQLRSCTAEDVVSTLWRRETVPEWVNVSVIGRSSTSTIVEILSCGRFTANESILYHAREGRPPFHVLGPSLPVAWTQGQRFSIHHRAACATEDELAAMRAHADKVWSLALEGDAANDASLEGLPELRNLELLDLEDSGLRGHGLTALERHPRLRVLRIRLLQPAELDVAAAPKLRALELLTIHGLPPRPWGFGVWMTRLPALDWLDLQAPGELHLDASMPKRLGSLTLAGTRLIGSPRLPETLESLSLHLTTEAVETLAALLAPVRQIQRLSLRGTPVPDDFVEALVSRWALQVLDVTDTPVASDLLRKLAKSNPDLRLWPRVDLGELSP